MNSSDIAAIVGAAMMAGLILPASAQQGPTVYAKSFSTRAHAGTLRDPWPGSAIAAAANSLPAAGGTVLVDNGIWLFSSQQHIPRGNLTLQGTSLNAQLYFTNGFLTIGAYGDVGPAVSNVTIDGLTIDASHITPNSSIENEAVQVWKCNGCQLINSVIYGHSNNSIAAFISLGGSNWHISNNKFTSKAAGGSQLQMNPLYDDSNSGFLVDNNEFDSVNMLSIGINSLHVTNNYMHNKTLGYFISMFFSFANQGTNKNLLFDYNTIDATVGSWNGAVLSGIPQDPGLTGGINGIIIDHNTLRGTGSVIAANDFDPTTLAECISCSQTSNITITNNNMTSMWGGSVIDVSGGKDGSVNGGSVQGNTLINGCSCGQPNAITQDAHTSGVAITGNSFQNTLF